MLQICVLKASLQHTNFDVFLSYAYVDSPESFLVTIQIILSNFGVFVSRHRTHFIEFSWLNSLALQNMLIIFMLFYFYRGSSLIDYLDNLPPMDRKSDGPLRLPIVDRFKVSEYHMI